MPIRLRPSSADRFPAARKAQSKLTDYICAPWMGPLSIGRGLGKKGLR